MRAAIPKPINHLYSIFKVYLGLAVAGVMVAIGVQALAARPFFILFSLIASVTVCVCIGLALLLLLAIIRPKSDASKERSGRGEALAINSYEAFAYHRNFSDAKALNRSEEKWREKK